MPAARKTFQICSSALSPPRLPELGPAQVAAAVEDRLVQGVLAHGDGGDVKDRVHVDGPVEAVEFAVRAFLLAIAELVEIAFDDHLGVGRRQHPVGEPAHHRDRFAAQGRHQGELVGREPQPGGEIVQRMRADGEAHRQCLAALDAGDVAVLEIGRLREVRAHGAAVAEHQAAAADIGPAGGGVYAVVDARRDIGCAVELVLEMERQFGQVDIVALEHHLMHRRVRRRHFDDRLRIVHPPHVFVDHVALVGAEGGGEPSPAAGHRRHHLVLLGADPFEIFCLRRGLDDGTEIGERNRLLVDLHFTDCDQLLDEGSQPELVEVDVAGRHRLRASTCVPWEASRSRS